MHQLFNLIVVIASLAIQYSWLFFWIASLRSQ